MVEPPFDNAGISLYSLLLCLMVDEMELTMESAASTFRRITIGTFVSVGHSGETLAIVSVNSRSPIERREHIVFVLKLHGQV